MGLPLDLWHKMNPLYVHNNHQQSEVSSIEVEVDPIRMSEKVLADSLQYLVACFVYLQLHQESYNKVSSTTRDILSLQ